MTNEPDSKGLLRRALDAQRRRRLDPAHSGGTLTVEVTADGTNWVPAITAPTSLAGKRPVNRAFWSAAGLGDDPRT